MAKKTITLSPESSALLQALILSLAVLNLKYTTDEGEVKLGMGLATSIRDSATQLRDDLFPLT